jgi:hypothetical protein
MSWSIARGMSWRRGRRIGGGVLALLALVLVLVRVGGLGCAGRWHNAALVPESAPVPADLMAGEWLGTWASSRSDMKGELRCRIEKQDEGVYLAQFDAVVARLLTNRSTTTLRVQRQGQTWEFTGQEDLGFLKGGVYTYQGYSDGREFVCSYDSKYDTGTFRMNRLQTAE